MVRLLRQLAGETVVYGLAAAASSAVAILTVPIYTRIFDPEEYGTVSLVTTAIALAAIFVVLALDNSAHRWYWDTEDLDDRKRSLASWFWCQLTVSLAMSALIVIAAPTLASVLGGGDAMVNPLRLAALALPLMTFCRVANGWLRLQRRALATAAFAVGLALVIAGGSVFFVAVLNRGIEGLFLGQLVAYGVLSVVAVALLRDWVHPSRFCFSRLREMLRFAVPLIPAALSLWVVNLLDRYFVNLYSSKHELGLYQVGYQVSSIVALASSAFHQAYGPFALSIQHDVDALHVYGRVLLMYLWCGSLGAAAVTMFSPQILQVFTTPAYYSAYTVVGFLSFSYVMIGLMYIAALGPTLARTTRPIGFAITLAALLTVVLNFALTPRLGKEGAAIATLVSWAVVPVYLFRQSQRLHPIPYRFGAAIILVAVGMGTAFVGVQLPSSLVGSFLKALLLLSHVPMLFILGIVGSPYPGPAPHG